MDIISRAEWGARPARNRITTTWAHRTEFVVHHSEGPTTQTVRSIQDFHMGPARGWSDVGYNFLVDSGGRIYEGRGWLVVGAHAVNHNTSGIGVCFIGRDGDDVTAAAKRSIRWLYDVACRHAGRTLAKRGHGELSGNSTSCPGRTLLRWVGDGMPVGDPAAPSEPSKPTPARPGVKAPAFPLPDGHWFGPESSDKRNHSGFWSDDRAYVRRLQEQLRARGWALTVTGRYDARTAAVVKAFQKEKGLVADGLTGAKTWPRFWTAPLT